MIVTSYKKKHSMNRHLIQNSNANCINKTHNNANVRTLDGTRDVDGVEAAEATTTQYYNNYRLHVLLVLSNISSLIQITASIWGSIDDVELTFIRYLLYMFTCVHIHHQRCM